MADRRPVRPERPARAAHPARRAPARGRARALIAAAFGLTGLLTGCATVPTDGDVTRIRSVADVPGAADAFPDAPVRPLVAGPKAGASPEEIVRGFLDAQVDQRGDHDVARLYLAEPTESAGWTDQGATVYTGDRAVSLVDQTATGATVALRARQAAVVTPRGEYRPDARPLAIDFSLVRVDGEWRLARPRDGLVLSERGFRTAFDRATLFFPDTARAHLVPDPIFLPDVRSPVAGILTALLDGPSDWLAPAVRSAFPPGTRLLEPPKVLQGIAQVNLSSEADTVPSDARAALVAQLVWTLTEPGLGVTGVRVLVEGRAFAIAGVRQPYDRDTFRWYDPQPPADEHRLFFVRDGRLLARGGGPGAEAIVPDEGVVSAAVGRDGGMVAIVVASPGGRTVRYGRIGTSLRSGVTAEALTPPSWTDGAVWTVRSDAGTQRVVRMPVAAQAPGAVQLDIGDGRVTSLLMSPEGARAALVVDGRLYLVRVETVAGGTALSAVRPVAPTLTGVTATAWLGSTRLALVGVRAGDRRAALYEVEPDGFDLVERSIDGLPGPPVALAARFGQPLVAEVAGRLYRRAGAAGWSPETEGTAPRYAG